MNASLEPATDVTNAEPRPPREPQTCPKCGAAARSEDAFCEACGAKLDASEPDLRQLNPNEAKHLKEARQALAVTSVIFALSGVVLFFLQRTESMDALQNLEGYDAAMSWPVPIEGRSVTVGELRRLIHVELWSVLGINLFLAAIMAGLFVWARKAPFPAMVTGAAVFAAVQVLSAIIDPKTLVQGWIIKIIVISALYKGIKAALTLRGRADTAPNA